MSSVAFEVPLRAPPSQLLGDSGPLALDALAALGQQTRLAIFRFLVMNEPRGRKVGEIAQAMGCPQNTTSSHLAVLARGKLVSSARHGRSVVYRADLRGMQKLLEYLLADCCNGDLAACTTAFSSLCSVDCTRPTGISVAG